MYSSDQYAMDTRQSDPLNPMGVLVGVSGRCNDFERTTKATIK